MPIPFLVSEIAELFSHFITLCNFVCGALHTTEILNFAVVKSISSLLDAVERIHLTLSSFLHFPLSFLVVWFFYLLHLSFHSIWSLPLSRYEVGIQFSFFQFFCPVRKQLASSPLICTRTLSSFIICAWHIYRVSTHAFRCCNHTVVNTVASGQVTRLPCFSA